MSRLQKFCNSMLGKITHFILIFTFLTIAMVTSIVYFIEKNELLNQAKIESDMRLENIANKVNAKLNIAKTLAQTLASTAHLLGSDHQYNSELIMSVMSNKSNDSFIAGGGIWPEPFSLNKSKERDSYFFGRDAKNQLVFVNDYNKKDTKGYHQEEWYVPVKLLKKNTFYWSKSYTDPYTFQPMVTISVPIYINKTFFGISTVDVKLNALDNILSQESRKVDGFAFIIDRNDKFISYPSEYIKTDDGVSVLMLKDFLKSNSYFKPISDAIDKIVEKNLSNFNKDDKDYADALREQSYQIDDNDANSIVAMSKGNDNIQNIYIENFLKAGADYLVVLKTLPSHWKIGMATSHDLIFSKRALILQVIVYSILFSMLLVGFIGYFFLHKNIVQPILDIVYQLTHSPTEYTLIDTNDKGELKTLVDSLNHRTKLLQQSSEELVVATRVKDEFLASMSHEIRTPITAIDGFVEVLKKEETDSKKKQHLAIISKSSDSLMLIVNDILDFSNLDSGNVKLNNTCIIPTDMFEELSLLFYEKAKEKKIYINLKVDENVPHGVIGDSIRIKQIVGNLLDNAIKFSTSDSEVLLNINYDLLKKSLHVTVKDYGIGIKFENRDKVFEPFNQEDTSTTRKYGGTGLGLSISKNLAKLMNGDLILGFDNSRGSEFILVIPAVECKVKVAEKLETVINTELDYDNLKLNGKILLVEDNSTNQLFVSMLLEDVDIEVEIVSNGKVAVDVYKQNKYDLILMDENMPIMNGIEATRLILEYEKENSLTHTPIVALTANALKGDREKFLDAGMDEYISKPINKKTFYSTIKHFLDK
ncbi:ATP-binding protein [Sulfurimonas sp.]|nr:ATP-binding protein [Sulfurimonas sp.]